MKIFDQSITRATALKLKEFIDEATVICREKSKQHARAVLASDLPSQTDVEEAGKVLDCSFYDHHDCSVYAYEDFAEIVDKYADGSSISTVITNTELKTIKALDSEVVIEKAPDAFLFTGRPIEVFAQSEDAKDFARERAWRDLRIIADVFTAYANQSCDGEKAVARHLQEHISQSLAELESANSGKKLVENKDFERLSL